MNDKKKPRRAPAVGLPTTEAAEYLGVSPNTLRSWSDSGHVTCRRTPGGQRRYRKADLDKFIDNMEKQDD